MMVQAYCACAHVHQLAHVRPWKQACQLGMHNLDRVFLSNADHSKALQSCPSVE